MKRIRKWVMAIILISIAFPISTGAYGSDSKPLAIIKAISPSAIGSVYKSASTKDELSSDDVIQNKAFANLEIVSDTAYIAAGFVHPDNLDEEVMIEWFLYAWNEGEHQISLIGNIRETAINYVEVNTQLSVPEYDYYLLECKNKLKNEDDFWVTYFISQSRYGRIAPMNGIWERTGEVTSSSAILHTYLTEKPPFNATDPENLRVPPMAGYVQFHVYRDPELSEEVAQSGFYPVDDYIQVNGEWRRINYNFRWTVSGLGPDTDYYYIVETKSSDGLDTYIASNINSFRTSPEKDADQAIAFVVANCLDAYNTAYDDPLEAAERGLKVFDSMLIYGDQPPDFVIMQGDTVYYDGGNGYSPDVGISPNSEYIWRWLYWYAEYQFENLMYFFQQVPGYWQVDDHDYWKNNINDIIPDGWYIFRNVNPTPGSYGTTGEDAVNYYNDNPYNTSQGDGLKYWRSVRWGQHLELFIEDGRNFRNEDANLIWGVEQREWLEQQIRESDATFKIIVATTPLLGPVVPDAMYPSVIPDKHASNKFREETELFLNNIRDVENVFIVAGDRHFKYHSIVNSENYPLLSHFNEFGTGSAATPPHAISGGVPDSDFARLLYFDGLEWLGASAGYMRIEVVPLENGEQITFKLIGVTQDLDNEVVYQQTFTTYQAADTYLPIVVIRH